MFFDGKPDMQALLEEAHLNAEIARSIYDLRTRAKLTQVALAKKIGTSASVISRLEDADYEGNSLAMLRRIGAALGLTLKLEFVKARKRRAA